MSMTKADRALPAWAPSLCLTQSPTVSLFPRVSPAPAWTLQPLWHRAMADLLLSCLSHCCAFVASSWEAEWCVASTLQSRSCRSMSPFRDLQRGVRAGSPLWDTLCVIRMETRMRGGP